jgi:FkbM family methyltransferase
MFERLSGSWLKDSGIRTVIDVGANVGQFTRLIHAVLPAARIYAFEPLPDCYLRLESTRREIPGLTTFNAALGAERGRSVLHRNPYPDSSSLLPMADLHRVQFPFTAGPETDVEVQIETLDGVAEGLAVVPDLFVKMDVQGYEDQVIAGGQRTLASAAMVLVEVSFLELYLGAPTFADVYEQLSTLGFAFRGLIDQLVGPVDGALLAGDALFVRRVRGR